MREGFLHQLWSILGLKWPQFEKLIFRQGGLDIPWTNVSHVYFESKIKVIKTASDSSFIQYDSCARFTGKLHALCTTSLSLLYEIASSSLKQTFCNGVDSFAKRPSDRTFVKICSPFLKFKQIWVVAQYWCVHFGGICLTLQTTCFSPIYTTF